MTSGAVPFQFDVTRLLGRARRLASSHVGEVTINLPFVSVAVNLKDREKTTAREIVIRMADRRVLNGRECCDNCVAASIASLQGIRDMLVEQQVALSDNQNGPLYLLIDVVRQGIRQFLTYEERLGMGAVEAEFSSPSGFGRDAELREAHIAGLEQLRGHIRRSLAEIRKIADMTGEEDQDAASWPLDQYIAPRLSGPEAAS